MSPSRMSPMRSGTTRSLPPLGDVPPVRGGACPQWGQAPPSIGSSSVNSDMPNPTLAPYSATVAASREPRRQSRSAARPSREPGQQRRACPIWTPLISTTMPEDSVEQFGSNTAIGRPDQRAGAGLGLAGLRRRKLPLGRARSRDRRAPHALIAHPPDARRGVSNSTGHVPPA